MVKYLKNNKKMIKSIELNLKLRIQNFNSMSEKQNNFYWGTKMS